MHDLLVILGFGLAMSAIALVGSITLVLSDARLRLWLLPLVALAAGTLIGGALFHMLPAAMRLIDDAATVFLWTALGFVTFYLLETTLHWHHCRRRPSEQTKRPVTYLVLVADALHNFIGGLSIAALFLADYRLGLTAWFAAALHEVPQELGDFAVLVHGGWSRRRALAFNFLSALSFPLGGLLTWSLAGRLDMDLLIPFAAGNFLYIGAVDLIPETRDPERGAPEIIHPAAFLVGLGLLYLLA